MAPFADPLTDIGKETGQERNVNNPRHSSHVVMPELFSNTVGIKLAENLGCMYFLRSDSPRSVCEVVVVFYTLRPVVLCAV